MKKLFILLMILFAKTTGFAQNITSAEYFFNTDPGPGNGIPITISSPAEPINFTANIPTSALSPGFYLLAIRVRNANGIWSMFEKRGFYIWSAPEANTTDITAAEYFFDADPGPGNGTAIPVGPTGTIVNFT